MSDNAAVWLTRISVLLEILMQQVQSGQKSAAQARAELQDVIAGNRLADAEFDRAYKERFGAHQDPD